jgi:uncharacterized protein YndB with AHSA1/START domain
MLYSIQLEFFVFAEPDEVMELLTNADFIKDWSKADVVMERKVGGNYKMFNGWVEGMILKLTSDELVYTWKPGEWNDETKSEVHFKLMPKHNGTEVFVKHIGFPNQEEMENYKQAWDKQFFELMQDFLANRRNN